MKKYWRKDTYGNSYLRREYDYRDVINFDNSLGQRKDVYVDTVLRKRLKHITYKQDNHPRSMLIYGMAVAILFEFIKVLIESLFAGEIVRLPRIGEWSLRTIRSGVNFKGNNSERKRAKLKGYYTMIKFDPVHNIKKMKYGRPYIGFGTYYKSKIHELEDKGIKF